MSREGTQKSASELTHHMYDPFSSTWKFPLQEDEVEVETELTIS